VREYGDGCHGGELGRQLGDGAARQGKRLIAKGPLVKVDGMQGAEAVDAVKRICWQLETRGALDEGAVGQLKGWVKRDWCWQSLAAHGCSTKSSRPSDGDRKQKQMKMC